jgi:hypothetical protein
MKVISTPSAETVPVGLAPRPKIIGQITIASIVQTSAIMGEK